MGFPQPSAPMSSFWFSSESKLGDSDWDSSEG